MEFTASRTVSIFDPEPRKEIAAELAAQLPQPSHGGIRSDRQDADGRGRLRQRNNRARGTLGMLERYPCVEQQLCLPSSRQLCLRSHRRYSCRIDLSGIPFEVADRIIFPDVQAVAGLPPSAEYAAERCRNPDVYRDHRVPVDSDSHRPHADEADL